jgi:hypothetical protein
MQRASAIRSLPGPPCQSHTCMCGLVRALSPSPRSRSSWSDLTSTRYLHKNTAKAMGRPRTYLTFAHARSVQDEWRTTTCLLSAVATQGQWQPTGCSAHCSRRTHVIMVRAATARMRALGPPGTPHTMDGSAFMVLTPPLLEQSYGARDDRTTTVEAAAPVSSTYTQCITYARHHDSFVETTYTGPGRLSTHQNTA